jgi:hypothetical protein
MEEEDLFVVTVVGEHRVQCEGRLEEGSRWFSYQGPLEGGVVCLGVSGLDLSRVDRPSARKDG